MSTPDTTIQFRPKAESDIKKKIREHLEDNGWLVTFLIVSNKDGWPDVIACHDNARTLWVETKVKGNDLSDIQKVRHAQLKHKKHEVIVARSLQNLIDYLASTQIPSES